MVHNQVLPKDAIKRFEAKIIKQDDGCWRWNGHICNNGYGQFSLGGKPRFAHRASWILYRGEIPTNDDYHGTCVLHKCDNRYCVNPDHLFLGTNLDNIRDSMQKNRRKGISRNRPKGIKFKKSEEAKERTRKIKSPTRQLIKEIYERGGISLKNLGKKFGVTDCTVHRIVHS